LILLLGICATGVIYLPHWLDAWPVRHVEVRGVAGEQKQQQLSASFVDLLAGKNFFTVSLDSLRKRAGKLDWVASADVSRSWPDTLIVTIQERVPVAVWNDKQLVSNNGTVFTAIGQYDTSKLPHLFGSQQNVEQVMSYYHSISQALAGSGLKVEQIMVDTRLTARLTLDNGLLVVVDRDGFAFKLRRFAELYRSVLAKTGRQIKRVDLRYASGVAVQFAGTGNTAAAG
jgi:cell division protein FtsQ